MIWNFIRTEKGDIPFEDCTQKQLIDVIMALQEDLDEAKSGNRVVVDVSDDIKTIFKSWAKGKL